MNIDNIENRIKWEQYYDPNFNWGDIEFYINSKPSEDFIREFKDKLDWFYISTYSHLTLNFIREFKDKLDWNNISINQKLSEDFIREFADKVEWICISKYQTLSEPFMEEFANKLNWTKLSWCQQLSEPFIEKYAHRVYWKFIACRQSLTENFIRKYIDKLPMYELSTNPKIQVSEKFIEDFFPQLIKYIPFEQFCYTHKISKSFQRKLKTKFKKLIH